MQLASLLARVEYRLLHGTLDRSVRALTQDSRQAGPGVVFVAVPGRTVDGHRFVPGLDAAAVVVERPVDAAPGVTVVQVADARVALAQLAAAWHGHPSESVDVIGITGTNGKTTVTWMLEAIANAADVPIGVIGTTGNRVDGTPRPARFTTPNPMEWQGLLAEMRDAGCRLVAAEVSSIGLSDRRVDATRFAVGVYTNLSQDHLDVHGDMDQYAAAKARLFTELLDGPAVLNGTDPVATAVVDQAWRYGPGRELDLHDRTFSLQGCQGTLVTPVGSAPMTLPLVGHFNLENALAAAGAALQAGLPLDAVVQGLAKLPRVPGRLEPAADRVLVDYAHTPDALRTVLATLRRLTTGRLIVVFGCGGDRDRAKRPLMAQAATQGADVVVATSDNPRTEDPMAILDAMRPGLDDSAHIEPDRRAAIAWALNHAGPTDVVLIAGKGHETTQEIDGVKHPFDDRQVARRLLESP
jgi:UDP-N-acetylmuramoyl-L-alanyl-D-glutamate--2,6-diaminopimelate ligase